MSEAKITQVTPGECPPEGCPPFTRIECIAVDKIYDSCFQIHDLTRDTTVKFKNDFEEGGVIPCAQNGDIECQEVSRTDVGGGFFTITVLVTVPITLTNPNDPTETEDKEFTFTKTVTLCCPEGVGPDCSESIINFCNCVITDVSGDPSNPGEKTLSLTCTLQICLVLKCILRVQLLVPSYGFCVPAPCVTLPGVCPPTPPAQCF
jgi:hypothetical protein